VAFGDGMTKGYGDDKPDDDNSQDGRTMFGGYTSVLADLLTAAKGYPVTVANEGVQGTNTADGLAALPTLIAKYPNAQRFIILYGHNDYMQLNSPSGRGLHPGDPGYAGSSKDRLQRMIDMLKAAGKEAILAKSPDALNVPAVPPGLNAFLQEFNQVIDELYLDPANGITVTPPDFYTYYANHPEEHTTSDGILLTGVGHMHMGQMWRDALVP
jgi:lysophospholipase L1-like esterase